MPTDCVSACRGRRILLLLCPKGLLRPVLRQPCGVSTPAPKAPCGWVLPISLAERHFFECGRTPPAACLQPGNHARRQRPPRQCTRSPRPPDLPALPPGQHASAAGAMAAPRRRLRSPRSRSSAARSTIFGVGGDGQLGPVQYLRRHRLWISAASRKCRMPAAIFWPPQVTKGPICHLLDIVLAHI